MGDGTTGDTETGFGIGQLGPLEITYSSGDRRFLYPVGNWSAATTKLVGVPLCPDMLSLDDIGVADGWRGHMVRGFFRVLRAVDILRRLGG